MLYVAIVVFVGVEGTLLYSVVRFRARKGRVAAQIRGNTRLEIGWTVGRGADSRGAHGGHVRRCSASIKNPPRSGPGGLPLSANGVRFAALDQPPPPGGRSLKIRVNGQQFVWRFSYPNRAFAYQTMVVPVDTTVTLDIVSQDVDHSWWIPKLGPKFDAIPGYTNHSWFKIPASAIPKGKIGRDLPRPVHRAVRLRTREHGRLRPGGAAGPLRAVGRAPEARDRPGQRRRRASSAPSSTRSRRRRGTEPMATREYALRRAAPARRS